jgi:hypothetical protein
MAAAVAATVAAFKPYKKYLFILDNKCIVALPFKVLLGLDITIPNEQRVVDTTKVAEIVKYQNLHHKTYLQYNFMGAINIHVFDNKKYLIDGQHRFKAIEKLIQQKVSGIDAHLINVEFVHVNTYEEMANNYNTINMNTGLPAFPPQIEKSVPEEVALYFFNKYPTHWSAASLPKRPNMNKNKFQEALGYLTKELNGLMIAPIDAKILKKYVEDYNLLLGQMTLQELSHVSKKISDASPLYTKCLDTKLYLGLFQLEAREYVYKWTLHIIRPLQKPKEKPKKKKEPIKGPIKSACWDTYIGKLKGVAPCFCCRIIEIQMRSFHCGHVLAEANGGKATVENLRPICIKCNSEMGTMHMREFIAKFYEKNLKLFDV